MAPEIKNDIVFYRLNGIRGRLRSSAADTLVIEPEGAAARASVFFVHGLAENCCRHIQFAVELAKNGYQVILFDLPGHGWGSADARDLIWLAQGYIAVDEPQDMAVFLKIYTAQYHAAAESVMRQNYQKLKRLSMEDNLQFIRNVIDFYRHGGASEQYFIAGHSMGGLLAAETARRIAIQGDDALKGALLFSPAIRPVNPPHSSGFIRFLENAAWRMKPCRGMCRFLTVLTRLSGVKTDIRWSFRHLSDLEFEPEVQVADPLLRKDLPAAYLMSIYELMQDLRRNSDSYPVDIAVFAALDDKLINGPEAVNFGKKVQRYRGEKHNMVFEYPDFWPHELLRSSKKAEITSHVLDFLKQHCDT
jgi:alpha-beta hydrolase superfamily lysophospholipase